MNQSVTASGAIIGRPPKEPPSDAAQRIEEFAAEGFTIVGIAKKLGIGRTTLARWWDDHEELLEAFHRGRESERHALHNRLYRIAMDGADRDASPAAMFLLKSRHGYRENSPSDIGNRVSVTFNMPQALTLEQFQKLQEITGERVTTQSLPGSPAADTGGD